MDLEPVGRWFLNGKHASIAWPMQGCEETCLVNLPLRELPHFITMALFGPSVWGLRFIFFVLYVLAAIGFWKTIKMLNLPTSLGYFLVAVLFLDKGTLEMMRGCRPEILEMVFLAWGVYFIRKENYLISSLLFLSLAWVHPSLWFVSMGFWAYGFAKSTPNIRYISLLLVLISLAGFWYYIGGDYLLFYKQFSKSAGAHIPEYGFLRKFINHFYLRYIAYWKVEFWWILLLIISHIWLFIRWKNLGPFGRTMLINTLLTSLFWLFLLMPNHRYSVSLNMLLLFNVLFVFNAYLPKMNHKWAQLFVIAILMVPFGARVFLGLAHREERNPHKVVAWMNEKLPKKNTLLLGESIGSYWSLQHAKTKFAHDTQPQNAKFENFDQVFLLSRDKDYPVYAEYPIKENKIWFGWQLQGKTYAGICLYKVENQKIFNAIVKEGMKMNYYYD